MTNEEIFSHIDHTLLRADSTAEEIERLCAQALEYRTASVCIPAAYISFARSKFPTLNICTVVGFPLGYTTTPAKIYEAADAIACGADEIDMVVNLCDVANGDFDAVVREIELMKQTCGKHILKVIVETCYLNKEQKIELCGCVTSGGADYIKTSTGFGSAGAKIEDIKLFKKHIGKDVKIKAAGGIKTRADLEMFLAEGCERIGTSSAVKLLLQGE